MLAKGQNEQDNFARPTKDRSEDDLEEKFQYETHSASFCLTPALTGRRMKRAKHREPASSGGARS
jgi:hypothetical protein